MIHAIKLHAKRIRKASDNLAYFLLEQIDDKPRNEGNLLSLEIRRELPTFTAKVYWLARCWQISNGDDATQLDTIRSNSSTISSDGDC